MLINLCIMSRDWDTYTLGKVKWNDKVATSARAMLVRQFETKDPYLGLD